MAEKMEHADLTPIRAAYPAASNTIELGHTASVTDTVTAEMIAQVLRQRLGYHVHLVLADVAFLYSALGNKRIDVFPGAWTPDTHAVFLKRLEGRTQTLGTLSYRARVGWLVPDTIPATQTVIGLDDLRAPAIRQRFAGRIHVGEAGSGLVRLSERARALYRLKDWSLVPSSQAGATLALKRAGKRGDPIIATGRKPHWVLGALNVRFLEDPKRAFGGPQRIRILGHRTFTADHPWAAQVLSRINLPPELLQKLVTSAHQQSVDTAVDAFLAQHGSRVRYWVTGRIGR
ncbi:glycine betaine ABC transporter substrate-binding protein [Rhodovibrio salinarum]|nr:glycine betaine ABC transporter substrate-binding protein [Rhodovibrio salinarum]